MFSQNLLDSFIKSVDGAIQTVFPPQNRQTQRPSPAQSIKDVELSLQEQKQIAGLMRVNHAGEVCAQALYQGQAATARLTKIKKQMEQAALEEVDHLAWCEQRLSELNSTVSILNPLWYMGSFAIGALAGLAGDKISLGFVAETERQVTAHLTSHLQQLPADDLKSKAVLESMKEDELSHAITAVEAGGIELPFVIKSLMTLTSKIMTRTSYYL